MTADVIAPMFDLFPDQDLPMPPGVDWAEPQEGGRFGRLLSTPDGQPLSCARCDWGKDLWPKSKRRDGALIWQDGAGAIHHYRCAPLDARALYSFSSTFETTDEYGQLYDLSEKPVTGVVGDVVGLWLVVAILHHGKDVPHRGTCCTRTLILWRRVG